MKKSFLCLVALFLAFFVASATEVVFDFTANILSIDSTFIQQDDITIVNDEVTWTADKASSAYAPRLDNNMFRFYAGTTITVSSAYEITAVAFTFNSLSKGTIDNVTADGGTMSPNGWTGSAGSVTFYTTLQMRIDRMVVTLSGTTAPPPTTDTTVTTTPSTLTYMTCAEAQAAALAISAGSSATDSVAVIGYVTITNGVISRGQQTFWMDDLQGTVQTLQAYWCNIPAGEDALNVGDKVIVKGLLKNYNGAAEFQNGDVTILERAPQADADTISLTLCEAIEEGEALAQGAYSNNCYVVSAIVDSVKNTNTSYQSQTLLFECYANGKRMTGYNMNIKNGIYAAVGDTVVMVGKLTNYNGTAEFNKGDMWVHPYVAHVQPQDPLVEAMERMTAQYNIDSVVVFGVYFEEKICNDVVVVGSYKLNENLGWIDDPAKLVHMQPVPGYAGWYVAVVPYLEDLRIKPIQLLSDGTLDWSFQAGDVQAWQHVGGNEAWIYSNAFPDESEIVIPAPGVYIYRLNYFKNHASPCDVEYKTYTVTLFPPECGGYEPAIAGAFNNWSTGVPMQRNPDGTYSAVIHAMQGSEYKFHQAGIDDWSNEIFLYNAESGTWYPNPNLYFGEETDIYIDYSNGIYSLCDFSMYSLLRGSVIWPICVREDELYSYKGTIPSDFRPNEIDNFLYIWEMTYSSAPDESNDYISLIVGNKGWAGAGWFVSEPKNWQSADLLRRYIITNPDKFFLHLSLKATDNAAHAFYVLGVDNAGFTVGNTPVGALPVLCDFRRDGQWYDIVVSLADYVDALTAYTIDDAENILVLLSGDDAGAKLSLDNIYFYCTEPLSSLNPPLARVITEPEAIVEGATTEPLYSEQPELTISAEVNATIAVTDGYGVLFDGNELTLSTADTVLLTLKAPWPLVGNGQNTLYISANIIISSTPSVLPSSSAARRLRRVAGEAILPEDTLLRHPAISRFANVELAPDKQLCAVYYTDSDGNLTEGDPTKAIYHAAEQAYGEVDIDTQSFVPATALVFADGNFYTDYIDGKIDIVDRLPTPSAQNRKVEKLLINGTVYIIRDGKLYNVLGQEK